MRTLLSGMWLGLALLLARPALAAPTLALSKTPSVTSVAAGTTLHYDIGYTCSNENCTNVTITDVLPPELTYSSMTPGTPTGTYNAGTRTATWNLGNRSAGTSGSVRLTVYFPKGTTPDGATAVNSATLAASNATAATATAATVTASAPNNWTIAKTRSGGALDQDVFYTIRICPNSTSLVNLNNATLTDTLPTGVTFVGASNGGVFSAGPPATVSWNLGTIALPNNGTDCTAITLTVRYPSGTFTLGTNNVTDTAALTSTLPGGAVFNPSISLTHSLSSPTYNALVTKKATPATVGVGQPVTFYFEQGNYGNSALLNYALTDAIPAQVDVSQIRSGTSNVNANISLSVEYRTDQNANWTVVTGFPRSLTGTSYNVDVATLGLGAARITQLRWVYSSLPVGYQTPTSCSSCTQYPAFQSFVRATDAATGSLITPNQVVTNSAEYTYTGLTPSPVTKTATFTVANTNPTPRLDKNVTSGATPVPGGTVNYQIILANLSTAGGPLVNPVLGDLLDAGLDFVANSGSASVTPAPIFETVTNYNNTGRTLVRMRWENAAAYSMAVGGSATVSFQARVKAGTLPGPISNSALLLRQGNLLINTGSCNSLVADSQDLNGNANTTEALCSSAPDRTGSGYSSGITVAASPLLTSVKSVKGQLDSGYVQAPVNGLTVAGGSLLYKLQVSNVGNVQMKNAAIIDILPFSGDTHVLAGTARASDWRPNLIAPVATPAGVVVYYSTQQNPCRPELGYSPAGCTAAGWTVTPPDDITTVQALKFDFGHVLLNPLDTLELTWPMRAPIGAPTNGSVAYNSFGYIATRADNSTAMLPSEPLKIGIATQAPQPAGYGDHVWIDSNGNGIQEAGEAGLNGVRVDLYRDNGDGVQNPGTLDTLAASTLTTANGGGAPGYYQFTNIAAATGYYAVFHLPPGYAVTQQNQGGNDAVDSDVDPATNRSPMTTIGSGVYDYSWDLGLMPTSTASVGNYVWLDRNADGLQNEAVSDGLNGVTVQLYAATDLVNAVAAQNTANDGNGNPGHYRFENLTPGSYVLKFVPPSGYSFTTRGATGGSDPVDSDPDTATGLTETFTLGSAQYDANRDAGMTRAAGNLSLGDRVWFDANNNGVYEPFSGETGINNVQLVLYQDSDSNNAFTPGVDQYYGTVTTYTGGGGQAGYYQFTGLPAGNYVVQAVPGNFLQGAPLHGLVASTGSGVPPPDPDANIDADNNGIALSGHGVVSAGISLSAGGEPNGNDNPTLDFGFLTNDASLGDRVWNDTNGDGVQDGGEAGIANVTLFLDANDNGHLDAGESSTVTNVAGEYGFSSLLPGTFRVRVLASSLPTGFAPTHDLDGRASPNLASTTLALGQNRTDVDFGYMATGAITGHLYIDANRNGVQDTGDLNLAGVDAVITDVLGATHRVTSGSNGDYTATGIPASTASVKVDTSDPDFPALHAQTEGSDPTALTIPASGTVSAGNDGYAPPVALMGTLFRDNGKTGGIAANGIQGGGEPAANIPELNGAFVVIVSSSNVLLAWAEICPSTGSLCISPGHWSATIPYGANYKAYITTQAPSQAVGQTIDPLPAPSVSPGWQITGVNVNGDPNQTTLRTGLRTGIDLTTAMTINFGVLKNSCSLPGGV